MVTLQFPITLRVRVFDHDVATLRRTAGDRVER